MLLVDVVAAMIGDWLMLLVDVDVDVVVVAVVCGVVGVVDVVG